MQHQVSVPVDLQCKLEVFSHQYSHNECQVYIPKAFLLNVIQICRIYFTINFMVLGIDPNHMCTQCSHTLFVVRITVLSATNLTNLSSIPNSSIPFGIFKYSSSSSSSVLLRLPSLAKFGYVSSDSKNNQYMLMMTKKKKTMLLMTEFSCGSILGICLGI